jgi:hypothetical protein
MNWDRIWASLQVLTHSMATDMANRRQFLAGLLATGLAPVTTWADAGFPAFLSAAMTTNGSYVLCGINATAQVVFQLPLPARGHAAAAHPTQPIAVAFARRPGTFAIIIDCISGKAIATLAAPKGRHFYGHGAFSLDGSRLYTTENDFEAGAGRVGVWDVTRNYARITDFRSGGIGPHDIKRLPQTDVLVVANGGIDTHPDTGRTKLNIPSMTPNISYILDGSVVETCTLAPEMHKNSIRHLAVTIDGQVAFGMQWQGENTPPALVGTHRRGAALNLMQAQPEQLRPMKGYVGSVAFSGNGDEVIVTSPRGGLIQQYNLADNVLTNSIDLLDASGAAMTDMGVMISTGTGALVNVAQGKTVNRQIAGLQWDNHLVSITAG